MPRQPVRRFGISITLPFAFWMSVIQAQGGDWPQILGPQRNGIAEGESLAPRWPRGGPPEVWSREVGSGYAGLAVAGNLAVLFHRIGDEEVIEGLSLDQGQTLFRDASPTTFTPQVGSENGPLCVPVLTENHIVTYGAQGLLTCLNRSNGQRLWQRKTHWDFKAPEGYFGAGSSPIVINDLVIVNVGASKENAGIVAFSLNSGETIWKQTNEPASYAAPVRVDLEGLPMVLMLTRYHCQLVDPAGGSVLFQFPFGQRGPTVNAATPLVLEDRLLVTASYGIGTVYGKFDLLGFHPLFEGETPLATQYCTPIVHDGHLYVIDGREDVPPADLKCIELGALRSRIRTEEQGASAPPSTTPLKWSEQNFGYGTLLLADGKLLALKTSGELLMIKPSPEGFKVISKCRPLDGTARALPALSDGKLLIRDEHTLKCLNLGR